MKNLVSRTLAGAVDLGMCSLMNVVQWRHGNGNCRFEELQSYLTDWEGAELNDYYAIPGGNGQPKLDASRKRLSWQSPLNSGYPENDEAVVDLFPCDRGWNAPTVLMLHALMSASDFGYRLLAKRFNEAGWNACFVHLPYHYERRPRGYLKGELAISSDLVRTAEGIRQAVLELRQLMLTLREEGCEEFGVWGTSYGGWVGSLLSFVEDRFRFLALLTPIVNLEHALWQSPAAATMRSQLKLSGIEHEMISQHTRLTSPLEKTPLCGGDKAVISAGSYDRVAVAEDVRSLADRWPGSEFLLWSQGHFGYRMTGGTFRRIKERGFIG